VEQFYWQYDKRFSILPTNYYEHAPVAQLDRAPDFESGCRRFESCRVYHKFQTPMVVDSMVGTRKNFEGCQPQNLTVNTTTEVQ
jgi:hypothetical protein